MKIYGTGLLEVSKEEDAKWFLDMYEQSHWQNIVDYKTFRVTRLDQRNYKYVIVLEAGGGINRLIKLEHEQDHIDFYADPRLEGFGYSNISGMGYMRCWEFDGKYDYTELAMFCLDNSPYDMDKTDDEWPYVMENSGEEIADDLNRFLGEGHDCTLENTLYITQL